MIRNSYFICPDCFHSDAVCHSLELKILGKNEGLKVSNPSVEFHNVICPKCGGNMFECDAGLVDIIKEINKFDCIKTDYCCEGHLYTDMDDGTAMGNSLPYMMFNKPYDDDKLYKAMNGLLNDPKYRNIVRFDADDVELEDDTLYYLRVYADVNPYTVPNIDKNDPELNEAKMASFNAVKQTFKEFLEDLVKRLKEIYK